MRPTEAIITDENDGVTRSVAFDSGHFVRARQIFEAALERPMNARPSFITTACGDDVTLRHEVDAMLAAASAVDPLLGPPGMGAIADRFDLGTVVAGRYRILGAIGRGGMGEVYRAEDLILNQVVALKFLDAARMSADAEARCRDEVRAARQVSHPNVCRVHDIGVADGTPFISMEYIDGEDLASLLRRIGRLPPDKAFELARKICAGLHASHDRGVLHRDLKPANIMIDGRGQPRITDFGLAGFTSESATADMRSGTPAYMAPEQAAGRAVTARSDIYALGLVLHEMFTGRHKADTTSAPSVLVSELDPAIDRVIAWCLDPDPQRRPASALKVALALPGGDPIAAALAVGDTPSPEMVAASQEREGLTIRAALWCFVAVLGGAAGLLFGSNESRLLRVARLEIPPDALAYRAEDVLRRLGYSMPVHSRQYGFECCAMGNLRYAHTRPPAERDEMLRTHQPPVMRFWYRQHRDVLYAPPSPGVVGYDEPPNTEPGMVRMALDPAGRLLALDIRPVLERAVGTAPTEIDWATLIEATGFSPTQLRAEKPSSLPPMPFDSQAAWMATPSARARPVRIEAAAWRGRPVFLTVAGGEQPPANFSRIPALLVPVAVVILLGVVAGAILVARHNLRHGRGDRRGAAAIVTMAVICSSVAALLTTSHVARPWEVRLLFTRAGELALQAAILWCAYMAIEPYMRRFWPASLISWNRFLSRRVRDPLVASHVLAGLTAWTVTLAAEVPLWQFVPVGPPYRIETLNGANAFAGFLVMSVPAALTATLRFLVVIVVVRLAARRRLWIADALACAAFALTGPPVDTSTVQGAVISLTLVGIMAIVLLWLVKRFGLLALFAALFGGMLVSPTVMNTWYASHGLVAQSVVVVSAGWAVWVIVSSNERARDSRHA